MCTLPPQILGVLAPFAPVFSDRVWQWVLVLGLGAVLATGQRTVASILRVVGLSGERQFQNYHRVLNRAVWSSKALSRILLQVLVRTFVASDAPIIVGMDETIERRRGAKIAAKGIYRDPVRSSKSHFVKTSGLRWISLQLLAPIPWAKRVWALPFLTVLAPSERADAQAGRRHKTLAVWGRQLIYQLRRWLPDRELVLVVDSTYAVLELLAAAAGLRQPVTVITRLRLDAALYDLPPTRPPGTRGRPRRKGARQPTLAARLTDPTTVWEPVTVGWYGGTTKTVELASGVAVWYHSGLPPVTLRWVLVRDPAHPASARALLSTNLALTPAQIVSWFVLRWRLEVTFQEVRAHLGVETQRQWSDLAIRRTTPALLGLFSLVTLIAHDLAAGAALPVRRAAWYPKASPTFPDALAAVRQALWPTPVFATSPATYDRVEIPRSLFDRFTSTLAYAA